ncbi:MAG: aminoacyl-tRNA hydrolase, partial [Phycisphaerae bacterium]|nr:aminoacyl-tRNA hydrolase [Phycisphaerae bacterium]
MVGLGNPGRRYAKTRHNVGFRVLEVLRRRWRLGKGRKAFGGRVIDVALPASDEGSGLRRVGLLAPMTFMNLSGRAVREMASFYKARPDEILIVLDDIALPIGRLRARASG